MPDESKNPPPPPPPQEHLALPEPPHDDASSAAPAFGSAAPHATPAAPPSDLAMRLLYDEQARMRAELEQLKSKDGEQGNGEEKAGGKKGGGDEGGGGEEGGGDEGGGEKKPKTVDLDRQKRQRARWTFLGILIAIPFLIIAVLLFRYLGSYENTDDAFVDGHTDPISSRISGTVANVFVENTFRVKKGQLLLTLDPRDYQVAKEQADANLEQAQAAFRAQAPQVPVTSNQQGTQVTSSELDVVRAEAQVAANEEQYRAAIASLHEAEANAANAVRQEERYRQLVVKEEVSRERYDQQFTQRQAQAAQVASRREQAEAARRSITQAAAQLSQAREQARLNRENLPRQIAQQRETLEQRRASAASSKAQADQAELNLQYTQVFAPEDGVIGDKQVQVATQVAAGQELLALTQTNDIWVTANFKETQIRKMRLGQTVSIHVDALGEDFDGYIENLPGASGAVYSLLPPENATGNYVKVVQRLPVRIRLRPGQRDAARLAPGMSVEPKVWLR